jgi:spore coat polysaccharide biosynthesis protein SpsF
VAIVQARMGATRLPGKVLRSLCSQSVLGHVVARVRLAQRLDGLVVATSEAARDDAVATECGRLGVACFRGSEEDVLARYYGAARASGATAAVRVTADCPLFDGPLLDRMLTVFGEANRDGTRVDYLSNVLRRTYPRGLDAEVFTVAALERAHRETTEPFEREHVTPYFYQHPERFRLHSFEGEVDLSGHRWTLDTPEDWAFVEAVYAALHRPGVIFSTEAVLRLLGEQPHLQELNGHVEQKRLGG